jgi:hypothetical protein
LASKDRELNNLHIFVGWASRPSHNNNKIVSYLILISKLLERKLFSDGLYKFVVGDKPNILDEDGITELRTVMFDTISTINAGEPF